ncbi:hypothetical protein, unlikely [Trypanosoma congolense IL3000]|uniref:Secreted protein n=1 Tax=Trypanosoma congolense (strain IL3000) TaxID=1068625 RepID=F9W483_TRYCI|nr:hypothetical protein, unlikely [Trypanosoma congolense IL3000]
MVSCAMVMVMWSLKLTHIANPHNIALCIPQPHAPLSPGNYRHRLHYLDDNGVTYETTPYSRYLSICPISLSLTVPGTALISVSAIAFDVTTVLCERIKYNC